MLAVKALKPFCVGACLSVLALACNEKKSDNSDASPQATTTAQPGETQAPIGDAAGIAGGGASSGATAEGGGQENFSPLSIYEYRDIFNSYARTAYSYTDDQVTDLVYPPNKDLITFFNQQKAATADPLAEVRRVVKPLKPSDLHAESKKTAWKAQSLAELEASFAKSGPVTLLLFNGVMSELSALPGWNDVFQLRKDSSLTKKFAQKMIENKNDDSSWDLVYSGQKQGSEAHLMTDMVKMASFDDANGNPLVNIILLQPLFGSMESFSSIEENSSEFLRRVTKIFKLLGETPNNIYLLGYSRGTPVALNFLTEARKSPDRYPWAAKIGGLISYAGVSFGTDLADEAYPMEPKAEKDKAFLQQLTERMKQLELDLQPFDDKDSAAAKAAKAAANTKAWASTGFDLGKDGLGLIPAIQPNTGRAKEKLDTQLPNLGFLIVTGKNYAFDLISANHIFSQYSENINRYKDASRRYIDAFDGLSTKRRLEWWKSHQLPKDVKLISLPTTMYDTTAPDRDPSPMLYKDYIVDHTATDYGIIRMAYYHMYNISGLELNDGLVPFDRSVLWPSLVTFYNPEFPAKNIYFTGIHSTNHFSLGAPACYLSGNKMTDPYPRSVVLRSLGTFISRIIAKGN